MLVALPEGPCRPVTLASQQPDEGSSERPVEHCVDDGVDGWRDVSQPEARVHHVVWNVAVWTCREDDIEDEERGPAQDEGEENQTQHFGGFLFRGHSVGGQRASLVPSSYEPGNRKLKHCQFIAKFPDWLYAVPRIFWAICITFVMNVLLLGMQCDSIFKTLPSTLYMRSSNTGI